VHKWKNLRKNREVRRKEGIVRVQKRHHKTPASSNPWSVCKEEVEVMVVWMRRRNRRREGEYFLLYFTGDAYTIS
jgi:hypothetical protein